MKQDIQSVFIAIITYKRPFGLKTLVDSLVMQAIPDGMSAHICVVDNDCTGENTKVVETYKGSAIPVALVEEPEKGIVAARNRCVTEFLKTECDALMFIDDDEWTNNTHWVSGMVSAYQNSGADIIASDVFTHPETPEIKWTQNAMGRIDEGKCDLQPITRFYTGNLFVKRLVFEKIQPAFDKRFALTGGSDLHFSLKCNRAGFKSVYTNRAQVTEIFPVSRANLKWFMLRGYRNGSGASRAEMYENKGVKVVLKALVLSVVRMGRGIVNVLLGAIKTDKGTMINGLMRMVSGIGTIAGLFNLSYDEYKVTHGK